MRPEDERQDSLENLEAQLRRLPAPVVPGDLVGRLVEAIPPTPLRRRKAANRRWLAVFPLATAAALGIAFLQLRSSGSADQTRRSRVNPSNLHSEAAPNQKETDPCNIVPPLPDWR